MALTGALFLTPGLPPHAHAQEGFSCGLKQVRGLSEDEASASADLVCEELKRASGGRGGYEVALSTLGRLVIVTASRRETGESITVRTDGVEEIPVAATRIAEALARDRQLADTQRVGNLLVEETRRIRTKPGEAKFLAGVSHLRSPGHGAAGASVTLGMMYAGARFSLPVEARFGWAGDGSQEAALHFFSASVGGRGYLTTRDVSPYVGGGLGLLTLDAWGDPSPNDRFTAERTGLGAYLEVGIEALRLHRARVALAVRADIPTYSLHSEEYRAWNPETGHPDDVLTPGRTKYVWPVSIGVSVAF
jgi:hypothetical protein